MPKPVLGAPAGVVGLGEGDGEGLTRGVALGDGDAEGETDGLGVGEGLGD